MVADTLDHVNIRSDCYAQSIAFYTDVLGLTVTLPPGVTDVSQAAWICSADGRPIIHLGPKSSGPDFLGDMPPEGSPLDSGAIHHVAFRCSDYEAMREKLERLDYRPRFNDVPQVNLRQIFVRDPNAILVELNFFSA